MNGTVKANVTRQILKSDAAYSGGLRCAGGGCPAVFETDQGTYFIVGRRLSAEEKASMAMDTIEDALEVPAELIRALAARVGR